MRLGSEWAGLLLGPLLALLVVAALLRGESWR